MSLCGQSNERDKFFSGEYDIEKFLLAVFEGLLMAAIFNGVQT